MFRAKAFMESYGAEVPSFQCSLLEASYLVPGCSLFGGLERSHLMCAWVTGWWVWSSICPSDLMGLMFGKSIAPHRTTAGSWCRQDMLWPLQHTRDNVYRTECTDFFLLHNVRNWLPTWVTFFFLSLAKCWLYCDLWLTCKAIWGKLEVSRQLPDDTTG